MNTNRCVETHLDQLAREVGDAFGDAVAVAILGPVFGSLDLKVREAVESIPADRKKPRAVVVLETNGGVVELVERMVTCLRHHFREVHFVIPDQAMSAGTIFALSGDSIWMDYFSCLGPIDPQVEKDGVLVPALAYVAQFQDLVEASRKSELTTAELILLQKLDLADLDFYTQARDLSISLLEEWLPRYKFKDWTTTESHGRFVTDDMRRDRAIAIARELSDHRRWKSHGRPISMQVLRGRLNLRIDDLATRPELAKWVRLYFNLLLDYRSRARFPQVVHVEGRYL